MLNQGVPTSVAEAGAHPQWQPPWWLLVPAAALAWWLVGYLPWLVETALSPGLSRPSPAVPSAGSALGILVFGGLTGGLVAGLLCLVAPTDRRWRAAVCALGGVALALAVVIVLASPTRRGGRLSGGPRGRPG